MSYPLDAETPPPLSARYHWCCCCWFFKCCARKCIALVCVILWCCYTQMQHHYIQFPLYGAMCNIVFKVYIATCYTIRGVACIVRLHCYIIRGAALSRTRSRWRHLLLFIGRPPELKREQIHWKFECFFWLGLQVTKKLKVRIEIDLNKVMCIIWSAISRSDLISNSLFCKYMNANT